MGKKTWKIKTYQWRKLEKRDKRGNIEKQIKSKGQSQNLEDKLSRKKTYAIRQGTHQLFHTCPSHQGKVALILETGQMLPQFVMNSLFLINMQKGRNIKARYINMENGLTQIMVQFVPQKLLVACFQQ